MRIVCACLSILLNSSVYADSLVIERVTVIDATGKPVQPDMTVVIEQGRIAAIGRSKKVKVPANSRLVEGGGKFLIPGLWDMHVHGYATPDGGLTWTYPLYLANGVVGVRDMFGPEDANSWRAQHAKYAEPSPNVYLGSPIIDGPKPVWPGAVGVADDAQARAAVDRYNANGADFIKIYALLTRDAYFAIADEARRLGIPFVGHVPSAIRVEEASDAGQRSLEHLVGVPLGTSSEEETLFGEKPVSATFVDENNYANDYRKYLRAYATYDEVKAQALFARFIKNGTWQCPTLVEERANAHLDDDRFSHREWLRYLPDAVRTHWKGEIERFRKGMTAADWADAHREFQEEPKLVGRMYRAGVGILAGTDAAADSPFVVWGFSLHDELALLVEAGLSPLAALQAATLNPARFMGQADRRGTIEVGKVADLVLLDRDPLVNIHNSTSIRAVVLGGKLIPRESLDDMLAEVEAFAARHAPNARGPTTN